MNRTSLAADHSMLFIFTDDEPRAFWMKNTLIPLDILYFDKERKLVSMQLNAQPCKADPCAIYPSDGSARYVLELPAGTAGKLGAEAGRTTDGRRRTRHHPLIRRKSVLARNTHVIRNERRRIDAGKLVPLVVEGNESLHDRFLHESATLRGLGTMEAGFSALTLAKWGEKMSAPSLDAVHWRRSVQLDHLEVVLGHAAIRAGPGVGDVFPARTRLDALVRQPQGFVVDEAANDAHPFAKGGFGALAHGFAYCRGTGKSHILSPPARRR